MRDDLDQDFLHGVFGVRGQTQHPQSQAVNPVLNPEHHPLQSLRSPSRAISTRFSKLSAITSASLRLVFVFY